MLATSNTEQLATGRRFPRTLNSAAPNIGPIKPLKPQQIELMALYVPRLPRGTISLINGCKLALNVHSPIANRIANRENFPLIPNTKCCEGMGRIINARDQIIPVDDNTLTS